MRNKPHHNRRRVRARHCELSPEESGISGEILINMQRRANRHQVTREVMRQYEAATGLAVAFAGRDFYTMPPQIFNALRNRLFTVLENSEERRRHLVARALSELGWQMNEYWDAKIAAATCNLDALRLVPSPKERTA